MTAMSFDILRPDDLLALRVETENLKLDTSRPNAPRLVVEDAAKPALLVFHFQPQSLYEQAFTQTDAGGFDPAEPLTPVGATPSRLSAGSRLAFRLPADVQEIAYTTEALLDWVNLDLVLSTAAAVIDGAIPTSPITLEEPTASETALELPYRLVLSPAALGGSDNPAWRHAMQPVNHAGRVEIWHTRLARAHLPKPGAPKTVTETGDHAPLPLRAVWSPDFVIGGPLPSTITNDTPFRGAMTPRDRDQIVILSSGYTGIRQQTGSVESDYTPKPIQATKLYLSALGGWLTSHANWPDGVFYRYFSASEAETAVGPPAQSPPPTIPDEVSEPGAAPPDRTGVFGPGAGGVVPPVTRPSGGLRTAPLDLVGWSHVSTAGRDQEVRLVYDGFLYPFGHRASLVKLTERIFRSPVTGGESSPVAYLRQKQFIVVRESDKRYDASAFAHNGREMPFRDIKIHTKTTPALDPVPLINAAAGGGSFWVYVGGAPFKFGVSVTDVGGHGSDLQAPMIFVPASETDLAPVAADYMADTARRACLTNGHHVAFADPSLGDVVFKTSALYFDTQPLDQPKPWITPPFLPIVDQASVIVKTLQVLLGIKVPVIIRYYPPYLQADLDKHAGVFAEIVGGAPGVGFTADKAGGFATPNLSLTALSTKKGLVAGDPAEAAAGTMKPSEFFGAVDAKLFGVVPLGDLVPLDVVTGLADASKSAPEIKTFHHPDAKNPTSSITHLIWSPNLADYAKDPVKIEFNQDAKPSTLTVDVAITRPYDGSAPSLRADSQLTFFRISLLGVVAVRMDNLEFVSKNHAKTIVTAHLAAKDAIVFEGPLSFVQTLASIMPSDMFGGSGLSIKMTPLALRVSYTLGFPPIPVGVFSLQNISITAGLILPWIDGKPGLEFAFARRNKPFLVTIEIFGGGGFIGILLDADGIQMVEGAIEFGGNFAFDVGVASGGVHVMAGIYFQLKGSDSDLTGFVDIGGEVSILGIISISLDLNLSLSWITHGKQQFIDGKATLSVSIHIVFFSVSVSVTVEKKMQVGGADPQVWQLMAADDWSRYAAAFA